VIRVVIVDDQPVVRAGVARILGPDDGFTVVAELDDGDQVAGALAERGDVDLVLMDVRMRRMSGPDAVRHLRATGPGSSPAASTTCSATWPAAPPTPRSPAAWW
jgi:DNA-binding NarL/FixJ family response regulator